MPFNKQTRRRGKVSPRSTPPVLIPSFPIRSIHGLSYPSSKQLHLLNCAGPKHQIPGPVIKQRPPQHLQASTSVPKGCPVPRTYCMQYTSAKATECAEILLPVSFRHVITGVVTNATRQCFACNSIGSIAGQMGNMLCDENLDPTSGKRKSNVNRQVRILEDSSHANSPTCSMSWYASWALLRRLSSGLMVRRRADVMVSTLLRWKPVPCSAFMTASMICACRSSRG